MSEQLAREANFEVHVYPHVNIEVAEDLALNKYTFHAPQKILPLKFFDAQPCVGKNIITASVEIFDENSVSLLLAGALYPYRARLDEFQIPECKDDKENNRFYRVLRVDTRDVAEKKRAFDMFGEKVFKHLAIKLVIEQPPRSGSSAEQFVDELRKLPYMH